MKQALIASVFFCVLYGLQIVLQQLFLTRTIFPIHLSFLTSLTSFVLLSPYMFVFKRKYFSLRIHRKAISGFFIATALWILADLSSVFGLKMSSSLNLSIFSILQIIIIYILAVLFLKEAFTKKKAMAIASSLLGSIILVYNFKSTIRINAGDLLFLVFIISISVSSLFRQKIAKHISSFHMSYLMFGLSTLTLGIITFFFFPIKKLEAPGFIVFNAIIGLVGFNMVNYAIAKGGATLFSLVSNLLPVFVAFFSFLIVKQLPTPNQIVGGLIIVFSIFIFTKHENR